VGLHAGRDQSRPCRSDGASFKLGVRDRSIFVGNPEDIVAERLGPDLPGVRDWTERHFDFAGYITSFEPVADREALRAELGYGSDERV
jgi:hypothetical protein